MTKLDEQIEYIDAMCNYIDAGANKHKRNKAFRRLQNSPYNDEWFSSLFHARNGEEANEALLSFFDADEKGLASINYMYYGILNRYMLLIRR